MNRLLPAIVAGMLFTFPTMSFAGIAVPLAPLFLIGLLDRVFRAPEVLRLFTWQTLSMGTAIILIGVLQAIYWQSVGVLAAILQLSGSVLLALWITTRWSVWFDGRSTIRAFSILMRVIGAILALATVEILVDFSAIYAVTDSILHQGVPVASNFERELAIAGFVRPRLFTSEPSHLAKNLLVLAVCALLCASTRRDLLYIALALAGGVVVIRSPIVAVGFVLLGFQFMVRSGLPATRALTFAIVLIVGSLGAGYFFADRLELFRTGRDLSAFVRLEVPLQLSREAIGASPFFGVGPGNDQFIRERAIDYRAQRGLETRQGYGVEINNGYATLAISLGIVGGFLYVVFVIKLVLRIARSVPPVYWLFLALLPFLLGAIFAPRFWMYLLVPIAVLSHHQGSGPSSTKR